MKIYHSDRLAMLTDRAKQNNRYTKDLEIGESCYLFSLICLIKSYRMKLITQQELLNEKKDLERQLMKYYQHTEIFDRHIDIRNRYSHILIQADKNGCPICKKLVRIFDGRDRS